ncbi:unnamed protein product, partial [Mesorhabditis spiculigera]
MRRVIIVALLAVVAYSRPATNSDKELNDLFQSLNVDIIKMLPRELIDHFDSDLVVFFKTLDFLDIMYLAMIARQKEMMQNPELALQALKRTNPNTYRKLQKLVDAYSVRYARLTLGAKKFFEGENPDPAKFRDLPSILKNTDATRRQANQLRNDFQKLAKKDRKSIQRQLPLIYKIFDDPTFLQTLRPAIEAKVKEQMTHFSGNQGALLGAA